MKSRLFWLTLLFIDLLIFLQAIISNNVILLIVVGGIAGVIYFKGYDQLFGEFDRKQKIKREKRKQEILELRKVGRKYSK
ncbi:hypothetical protein [Ligilactobacillus salivarius]|nr:hypothetical protein [Ligilactobacillus salivarius]ATP38429.1 hypothetical protein CR531_09810 [Ligilactobacillus salivarius]KRM68768.1 hypothetical protein FC55_GL000687 [Ligilactobacillus salivarius DSM 20555 = ATCC 11741]MBE7938786.1 hypothetical protein [Ligilactobacillus salivarius]MDD1403549.1 hypothetical protein [Ligilactobacillus salivarius]MDG9756271.1 hypothetical protein [Ligilactobacillus salivarius]